jgi:CRISPR-associated endonuclease/helicase Cas3
MIKPKSNNHFKQDSQALELNDCLAKTYQGPAGNKLAGRKVLNHCEIVGHIARELRRRLPNHLVAEFLPEGSELIAAAHDIGKVSPCFQEKIYRGTAGYVNHSKTGLERADPALEKNWGGHAGVSQVTAKHLKLGKYIPEILGQHHGYSPAASCMVDDESLGG